MEQTYHFVGEAVQHIEHLEEESKANIGFFISELEKFKQYTENLLHMNNMFEGEAKQLSMGNTQKKAFSEIVFSSRIYEFLHEELDKIKSEYKSLGDRLHHIRIMYKEVLMDVSMTTSMGKDPGEAFRKQLCGRLVKLLEVSVAQLEACQSLFESICDKAIQRSEEVSNNHQEIEEQLRSFSADAPQNELLEMLLENIKEHSQRILTICNELMSKRIATESFKLTLKELKTGLADQQKQLLAKQVLAWAELSSISQVKNLGIRPSF